MAIYTRRFFTYFLTALIILAFAIVSLAPAWSATGETTVSLVGSVTNPGTVSATTTTTQSLTATRYDLGLGPIASGQTWSGASLTVYLSQGRFATAPSVTVTDASGAAVSATVTATGLAVGAGSVGGSAAYLISGTLPSGAVMHFSSFAVTGLYGATVGTAVQIIAVASGAGSTFRQYATWQSLATVGSGGSTSIVPESGWWWSSAESGRGYAIEVANGRLMIAAYMYRTDGTSAWYVANGPLSGTEFTGTLTEYRGGGTLTRWQAASELGSTATVQVTFSSATTATLRWSGTAFGSSGATSSITRYSFTGSSRVTAPAASSAPETGWYWNAEETGTGWFLEMQGSQIFLAVYMYDTDGTARWYVAQGTPTTTGGVFGASAGLVLEADLTEYGGGQTLTSGPRTGLTADPKGTITVQFTSTTAATVALPNGRRIDLARFTGF